MANKKQITVFEHDKLTLSSNSNFDEKILEQLERYHGTEGTLYFSLIHKGVKFNQYVGVIQVGNTTIEVLPKVDRYTYGDSIWRDVLIDMLRITSGIEASSTSKSKLRLQKNSIFDLYIELFIKECEQLVHNGLIKKYRKVQENKTVLRGRLNIAGQIRHNIIHKERFFVEHNRYDKNHLINQILKKTLSVLTQIPIRYDLRSRVKRVQLYFEELAECEVNEQIFNRISLNRKTRVYAEALEIARLILLNYHPDISKGNNHVLALMFDMNQLWEKYITMMMKKHFSEQYVVKGQRKKVFWQSTSTKKMLKPDIILTQKDLPNQNIIIDTKWKAPSKLQPSDNDLKQIFAYNQLFDSKNGILLYPGKQTGGSGSYLTDCGGTCSMQYVNVIDDQGKLERSKELFSSLLVAEEL